jgi:hypothetical protein
LQTFPLVRGHLLFEPPLLELDVIYVLSESINRIQFLFVFVDHELGVLKIVRQ